jgi:type IV secretory pathway ATPase VirB11/archaellum biosynthesis ATPase
MFSGKDSTVKDILKNLPEHKRNYYFKDTHEINTGS